MELCGILVIDKPAGPTSFDVVRRVRSHLKVGKVGHTGTLDPAATGVLPICLGPATRLASYITEGEKTYEAVVRLGASTDTQDAEGKVLEEREMVDLTPARLLAALERFTGTIQQVPPMYSAVKVGGKRLYELARAGQEVAREARPVTVHALELLAFGVPEFKLRVRCSKGTYVRTLAHDLGQALGCGAHLAVLRRTQSGPFQIADAVSLESVLALGPEEVAPLLVSLDRAFPEIASLKIDAATLAKHVAHGMPLELPRALIVDEGAPVKILGPDGAVVAMAERRGAKLCFVRVLVGGDKSPA